MKFNVAKCHSMRVTRHLPDKQILFDYTLHQQKLEHVQSAKYLGLTITGNLDWGQHVSEILCKATKTMGFLRRNLALAPRHTKEVAYKTMVRPQLKYAAPIWNPYHKLQIQEVEKVRGQLLGGPAGNGGTQVASAIWVGAGMSIPKMSTPIMSIPIMSTVPKCLFPLCLLCQNVYSQNVYYLGKKINK